MNPIAMTVILVAAVTALAYSLNRRWQLLKVGREENRLDRIPERVWTTFLYAFGQRRMPWYPAAGIAHILIFFGFLVLLLRSLILWGRAFEPSFNMWVFGHAPLWGSIPLGDLYDCAKDVFAILVVIGAGVFLYLRLVVKEKRMTLHFEGLLILMIIVTMMIADILYDGSALALVSMFPSWKCAAPSSDMAGLCSSTHTIVAPFGTEHGTTLGLVWHAPAGSIAAMGLKDLSPATLVVLAHVGFWAHSCLVLFFANILPYTKHFHIYTSIPNVFAADLTPPGRLRPMAPTAEKLMEIVGAAAEIEDTNAAPIGVARVEHMTWKAFLDFYTCTECGRCTDNCPANRSGKLLSPKQFSLDLRDHLYARNTEFIEAVGSPLNPIPATNKEEAHRPPTGSDAGADAHGHREGSSAENPQPNPAPTYKPVDLIPDVIKPEVIWACTTCRACEEFCPVLISYVDKFVDMRRNRVLVHGEFPPELQKPFQAMETNGNPWNLSRMDRAAWSEGLEIPTMAQRPTAEVLFWVGCAASYDDRAKKVARATARLMREAGVDFAILGEEENCTGDAARRAGNEFLFATLAEMNIATLNGYKEQGGVKTIVTACPHCLNTLLNEYPDFGGNYNVVHHADFLLDLVRKNKLKPQHSVKGRVVFHDSCYLGRYNKIYESPRDLLTSTPGVELVEVEHFTRTMGLCCGAGGAQMWMEEQNKDRMNVRRTLQLLETKPATIATACPFCMTMITDGLKDQSKEDEVRQLDIAEILEETCLGKPTKVEATTS